MNLKKAFFICGLILLVFNACQIDQSSSRNSISDKPYSDKPFLQEYHEAFIPAANPVAKDVRSIAVDSASNVWIATAAGVFMKPHRENIWHPIIEGPARGRPILSRFPRDRFGLVPGTACIVLSAIN